MGSLTDESILPVRVLSGRLPVGEFSAEALHRCVRVAIERLLLPNPASMWRPEFTSSAQRAPERPNVPQNHAADQALARSQRTSQTALFNRLVARCEEKGWTTNVPPSMMRWRVLLAQPTGEQRIHVFVQPPLAIKQLLDQLWSAGFRIDGFVWTDSALSTAIETSEQMDQVRGMVQWVNNYCAMAGIVGLPPEPWTLTAARSLVERINRYDSSNLASN